MQEMNSLKMFEVVLRLPDGAEEGDVRCDGDDGYDEDRSDKTMTVVATCLIDALAAMDGGRRFVVSVTEVGRAYVTASAADNAAPG